MIYYKIKKIELNLVKGLIPMDQVKIHYRKLITFVRAHFVALLLSFVCLIGIYLFIESSYKNNIPDDIKAFYLDFLDSYCNETFYEVDPYLHYEVPEYWKLTEDDFSNITSYQIVRWERLSSDLWVVTLDVTTTTEPEGCRWHHFVGYLNSDLYVMIGVYQIPDSLAKGLNLNRFIPKNTLSPYSAEIFNIFN